MSPQLREFIDRVIVPALVERFLREQGPPGPVFEPRPPAAGAREKVEEATA
jgi:hypothetical protein